MLCARDFSVASAHRISVSAAVRVHTEKTLPASDVTKVSFCYYQHQNGSERQVVLRSEHLNMPQWSFLVYQSVFKYLSVKWESFLTGLKISDHNGDIGQYLKEIIQPEGKLHSDFVNSVVLELLFAIWKLKFSIWLLSVKSLRVLFPSEDLFFFGAWVKWSADFSKPH